MPIADPAATTKPCHRPRGRPHLIGLACAALLSACASLPPREPSPPRAPVTALDVHGAKGPVSAAQAARRIAAEGRTEHIKPHLEVLAGLGGGRIYRGNTTQLLVDGPATFAAMKKAIAGARHRVLLQSYIVEDEGVAARIAELLLERAAAGVTVALLYDDIGSIGTPGPFFEHLRAGGVAVCAFNPLNPLKRPGYRDITQRDHRKLLVVDDAVAFTGGINISRVYGSASLGSGPKRRHADADPLEDGWRDTQIALRGPVVPALTDEFVRAWAQQACEGSTGAEPNAAKTVASEPGQRHVKLLLSDPREADNPIYRHLLAAIDTAADEVLLTMAYFAPGRDMVQALADAARRGVRVALVLPGRSDFALVLHAGRAHYNELLAAGVELYEMNDAVMHAKTAVIDGVWSTVGSSNLDWRSLAANHELNVVVLGEQFGAEMRALFERDRAASQPVTREQREQRGLGQRLLEGLGNLFERWL